MWTTTGATGERPALLCYGFSSPQWRLSLNAKQVKPLFTCSPRYDLTVLEDRVQLVAGFRIRQEAGEVRQLRVDTSGLEQSGWLMAPRGDSGTATVQGFPGGGGVQFEWPPGTESEKVAELRFERPVQNLTFAVPLPTATATWPESAQLTVRAADTLPFRSRRTAQSFRPRSIRRQPQRAFALSPRRAQAGIVEHPPEGLHRATVDQRLVCDLDPDVQPTRA